MYAARIALQIHTTTRHDKLLLLDGEQQTFHALDRTKTDFGGVT